MNGQWYYSCFSVKNRPIFLLSKSELYTVSMDLEHSKTWLILYYFILCQFLIMPLRKLT